MRCLFPIILAVLGQDAPAPSVEIERLEIELRLDEALLMESEQWAQLEKTQLDQAERENARGVGSPRRVEEFRQASAEAEATRKYRVAMRDLKRLELDQAKQRAETGSPVEDIDQLRARLRAQLQAEQALLASLDVQFQAAAALAQAEERTLDNLMAMAESGTIPPVALTQGRSRLAQARANRFRAQSRRDLAALDTREAEADLLALDDRDSIRTPAAPLTNEELTRRLQALQSKLRRLEDENAFLSRRFQRFLEIRNTTVGASPF